MVPSKEVECLGLMCPWVWWGTGSQRGATLCGHSPKSGAKAQKHLKLPRLEVIWGAKLLAAA